jgi:hypothetical protein
LRILVAAFVCLLLLPACGANTADPVADTGANTADPVADTGASGAKEGARARLNTMVVPREAVGGLPPGLRVAPDSGWRDNRVEAKRSVDPSDSMASLADAGRITGYELTYYDPTHAAMRSGSGVDAVMTWVALFSSKGTASDYLRNRIDYSRGLAGTSPQEGVTFREVTPFDVRVADEGFGLRQSVVFGKDHIFRTLISLRRGHIVAGVMVIRADSGGAVVDVERIAGILDSRIQIALSGGPANGKPVLIPKIGVPLDGQQPTAKRPRGAPDLAAIALGRADLPPGILCQPGRYTHTTPPRTTFRRPFCPQGAAVGHTRLIALASEVSVFESDLAAKASLSLTVQAALSPQGAQALAANFAATSGLVATNLRRRRVELEGGGVGVLTTFDTKAGRGADFYALVQSGRGLTTIDAIGPAEGFDHRDLLPLLQAVERRLGRLG